MDALQELVQLKVKIDATLNRFLDQKLVDAEQFSMSAKDMVHEIQDALMRGGKRIRPALVVMGYMGYGGKDENAIIQASIAMELLHYAFLVQDDVMDSGDTRHGGPAIHKVYEKIGKSAKHGENMAYCGSDILIGFALEVMHKSQFSDALKLKAIGKMLSTMKVAATGQMMDAELQLIDLIHVKEDDITEVHIMKTAKYTIEHPLHIGAILAGACEEELFRLSEYAIPLGQAFQIRDDVLGMMTTPEKLGKPVDSDLKEGKHTLLTLKTFESCSPEDQKKFEQIHGNISLSIEDFLWVKTLMQEKGAVEYSQQLAEKLVHRARQKLEKCELSDYALDFLDGIALYMAQREY